MFSGSVLKKNEDKLILSSTVLIVLITIILIAFIMFNTFSDNLESNDRASDQPAETTSQEKKQPSDRRPSNLVEQFARLNIFSQSAPPPSRNLKKTRLSLSLHGIIDADNPETSVVIVSAGKSSPETAYRIGDKLPGGATLKEVHKDHIVLLNRGAKESLFLSQKELKDNEAHFNQSQPIDEELMRAIQKKKELRDKAFSPNR